MDPDAVRSVERLQERDYDAYLVGGCVRDLLLGQHPKDFDLATAARPQQVKRVFPRNCRIIGRRFKLAHLHFHGNQKILEVATFRASPPPLGEDDEGDADDLLIVRDNEFGTMEEDALRRDFTVNALFMDPVTDQIIDYVDGMQDIEARVIRCIGDPQVRFQEDPVRILRAAKFAGRLDFRFDEPTEQAMRAVAPDLSRAAMPRVLEEILRLLRGGHALPSFQILHDIGALAVLLPLVADYLEANDSDERCLFWRHLEALDNHIHLGNEASNAVLLGALFLRPVLYAVGQHEGRSATTVAEEVIGPLATELRLPRRDAGALKRICGVQSRFTATGKRRYRLASFLRDDHLKEAVDLFALSCIASGENFDLLENWSAQLAEHQPEEYVALTLRAPAYAEPQPAERSTRSAKSPAKSKDRPAQDEKRKRRERDRDRDRDRDKPGKGRERKRGDKSKKKGDEAKAKKPKKDKEKKKRKSKADQVQTLEPEALDLSAFDIELAPREVPRFDTFVDQAKPKKKRRPSMEEADSYKPPPPPGTGDAPPPPPAPGTTDDVFGDW